MNTEEKDNSVSSFSSVGQALPYPDLVVWDDDGKICAVIVGRRIAIYLANPPNFTLLRTTHLGTANEADAKVESEKNCMEFSIAIHKQLYNTLSWVI